MKPHTYFNRYEEHESPILTLSGGAGTIELDIDTSRVHHFAGVVYFNDAEGVTPVQPTAGTETYSVKRVVQPQGFQDVPTNVIQANVVDQVNWAGNTITVKAVMAGIVGVTHAKLIASGNSA